MLDFAGLRQRMVDNQIRPSEIVNHELIQAFLTVPREDFVERPEKPFAYSDRELPLPASAGDRRMMDPVQLARLIQALPIGPASRVLIVGCGTGYSAALLARLAAEVVALEEDDALARIAAERLQTAGAGKIQVVAGTLTDGHPAGAPYDAILVDGAVEFVPDALIKQLKQDGALAVVERQERISRAMLYQRVGDGAAKWPQFEAWAPLLPGFARAHEFVF